MSTISRTTFCNVTVVTPTVGGGLGAVYDLTNSALAEGLTQVDVSTSVEMGAPNTFTLHFVQGDGHEVDSWARRIPQYSLVFIEMGSGGHKDGDDPTVMVGLTGRPQESETWSGGPPQRSVVISGRGLESLLWDAKVWFAPFLEDHPDNDARALRYVSGPFREQLTGRMIWAQKIWGKNIDPRAAIIQILLYYLGSQETGFVNLLLPQNFLIRELLVPGDYSPSDIDDQPISANYVPRIPGDWTFIGDQLDLPAPMLLPTASLHPQPGPIINLIHRVMDRALHEFYALYEEGRVRLVHRTKPFARGTGERDAPGLYQGESAFAGDAPHLKTVHVDSVDVISRSGHVGVEPIHNIFFVTPGQGAILANASFKAHVAPTMAVREGDRSFIGRFGVRPLEYVSPYLVVSRDGDVDNKFLQRNSEALNRLLFHWHDPHPEMWEGRLSLIGRAEFRPGRRLVWHGRDEHGTPDGRPTMEYYVKGVQHRYDFRNGAFRSELMVTRGWPILEAIGDWTLPDLDKL